MSPLRMAPPGRQRLWLYLASKTAMGTVVSKRLGADLLVAGDARLVGQVRRQEAACRHRQLMAGTASSRRGPTADLHPEPHPGQRRLVSQESNSQTWAISRRRCPAGAALARYHVALAVENECAAAPVVLSAPVVAEHEESAIIDDRGEQVAGADDAASRQDMRGPGRSSFIRVIRMGAAAPRCTAQGSNTVAKDCGGRTGASVGRGIFDLRRRPQAVPARGLKMVSPRTLVARASAAHCKAFTSGDSR